MVHDEQAHLWKRRDSDTVIVCFAGHHPDSPPPFNFGKATDGIPESALLLRDHWKVWYHFGLNGVAGDIDSSVEWLRDQLQPYEHVRIVGGSSGGYAALLFGALLGRGTVVAFGPQTFLSRELHDKHSLKFGRQKREQLYNMDHINLYGDLRPVLAGVEQRRRVFVGRENREDMIYANHLDGLAELSLIDTREHNVAGVLRQQGRLQGLIRNG